MEKLCLNRVNFSVLPAFSKIFVPTIQKKKKSKQFVSVLNLFYGVYKWRRKNVMVLVIFKISYSMIETLYRYISIGVKLIRKKPGEKEC